MNWNAKLFFIVLIALLPFTGICNKSVDTKPNFLIILIDDLDSQIVESNMQNITIRQKK